ncbi:MAG: GNAT family N-acetyltransferase [Pseudomonadales bacterium]
MDAPEQINLPDGASIRLKHMTPDDRDALLAFANALPQEDLLFLTMDITQPAVVDALVRQVVDGRMGSLVAYDERGLIGYTNVHRNPTPWMRRVGEIRVNVAPAYRARGLGRLLINRAFDMAREMGLGKIIAQMTADQRGAQNAFRRLGFVPEAILADFVVDRNGRTHDLVMMTFDVDGHTDQAGDAVKI